MIDPLFKGLSPLDPNTPEYEELYTLLQLVYEREADPSAPRGYHAKLVEMVHGLIGRWHNKQDAIKVAQFLLGER